MIQTSAFCTLKNINELEYVFIQHPKFTAKILLQGAQIIEFNHVIKGDFLWLSEKAEYKQGKSVRGGIPICWPWFGNIEFNPENIRKNVSNKAAAHGFARQLPWTLQTLNETAHGVSITLKLQHSADTLAIWPIEFDLTCRFDLSNHLSISLETTNLSNKTCSISQALHTYLPTSDIKNTRILGVHNTPYIDALDRWQEKKQCSAITFNEEVDRIYMGKHSYQGFNSVHSFELSSNSASSIIWNPWVEKSKRLSQFNSEAYKKMYCIESANVLSDHIRLSSKKSHSLNMTLTKN